MASKLTLSFGGKHCLYLSVLFVLELSFKTKSGKIAERDSYHKSEELEEAHGELSSIISIHFSTSSWLFSGVDKLTHQSDYFELQSLLFNSSHKTIKFAVKRLQSAK
jgi:hypothetical protein